MFTEENNQIHVNFKCHMQQCLYICNHVFKMYRNILNSYVSDYYIENHWKKLPNSWKMFFENLEISELSNLLNVDTQLDSKMYPLSLLCLHYIISKYTLPRRKIRLPKTVTTTFNNTKFMNFFWKNVKLKKRHEVDKMAQLCYNLAQETNCFYIVDIGSGLGHLSRMLSYGYGFKVCTFEAVEAMTSLAKEMDVNFERALSKRNIQNKNVFKTVHINRKITEDLTSEEFLKLVKTAFNIDNVKFGVVGLHPCGDLGAKLLKLYSESSNILFINIASCCYMKITLNPTDKASFPLSKFCKNKNVGLSYLVCEIACHAIENYSEKLQHPTEYEKLKIHAYRAALEDILISVDSNLKHSIIGSAKCDKDLTFVKYVQKICDNGNFPILPENKILLYENIISKTWRKVVIFYTVRLLLAPLVENIILLDRLLYILEDNSNCRIYPIFDCNVSPRNQVISAYKIKD